MGNGNTEVDTTRTSTPEPVQPVKPVQDTTPLPAPTSTVTALKAAFHDASRIAKKPVVQEMRIGVLWKSLSDAGMGKETYRTTPARMDRLLRPNLKNGPKDLIPQYENMVGGRSFRRTVSWKSTQRIHGLVFALDTSNPELINEAKDELSEMFSRANDCPILVFVDSYDTVSRETIVEKLNLDSIQNRPWSVEEYKSGPRQGFTWLKNSITDNLLREAAAVEAK